jgi:hypothetical protein
MQLCRAVYDSSRGKSVRVMEHCADQLQALEQVQQAAAQARAAVGGAALSTKLLSTFRV